MRREARFNLIYLLVAVGALFTINGLIAAATAPERIPYSRFVELLEKKQIEEVVITQNEIRGKARQPVDGSTDGKRRFSTNRVEPELVSALAEHGVTFSRRVESTFLPMLLSWVVPVLLFVGLWFLIARRMAQSGPGGGVMAIGKSKAKVYVETDTGVSFDDVAGVEEAKQELREVVSFLRQPDVHGRLGARMPKGVLLVGPPGTGKTLIAKAVAGEAGVPFFSISGSEFVEMFVGVGAARVRDLFEQARKQAPAIIFIDELDALGKARSSQIGMGSHDEKEQTLNQLLVELDGFDPASGIVLLGATNRPEILDPALLRAGRFDRQVLVDRPDKVGRIAILQVHARKITLEDDFEFEEAAALTTGFSGAELANLVNEAALAATRRGAEAVGLQDFTLAVERIVAGLERKNRVLNEREREIVAHHELGHAFVAAAVTGDEPVHKISIIPRGIGALGYTIQRPTEDRFLMTREELEAKMAVLLGGRAAERLVYGHLSTGAADDLSKATDVARAMATRYGMVDELGHVSLESESSNMLGQPGLGARPQYGVHTADRVDAAVRELVQHAHDRALAVLKHNRALLEDAAEQLLRVETLEGGALEALLSRVRDVQLVAARTA
ncbi:MAG: ATP-dependent zinc metalloprotease FtsH [Myxococcales bacterium]|nr:ATP-dependent zinc metalloprotease FtsH [Myxococcales bacterium]